MTDDARSRHGGTVAAGPRSWYLLLSRARIRGLRGDDDDDDGGSGDGRGGDRAGRRRPTGEPIVTYTITDVNTEACSTLNTQDIVGTTRAVNGLRHQRRLPEEVRRRRLHRRGLFASGSAAQGRAVPACWVTRSS